MSWLWVKALHVVFVVTWFAGLFYLPRLFVYHAESDNAAVKAQLKVMERRLLMITHVGGILALVFGIATLSLSPAYLQQPWMQAKLGLVICLVGYHLYLVRLKRAFVQDRILHSSRWLRLFNEIPGILLLAIVILVIVKPWQ
jgi:protoporphyrinogen IX oxidase